MKTLHTDINWELVQKMLDRLSSVRQDDTELLLAYLEQLKALGTLDESELLQYLKMAVIERQTTDWGLGKQEYVSGDLCRWDYTTYTWVAEDWGNVL